MGIEVVVRPRALWDIDEILEHLDLNANPKVVLKFKAGLEKSFQFLSDFPESGSIWESKKTALANVRVWPVKGFKKHLIFFRYDHLRVEILHVSHGHRDLKELF